MSPSGRSSSHEMPVLSAVFAPEWCWHPVWYRLVQNGPPPKRPGARQFFFRLPIVMPRVRLIAFRYHDVSPGELQQCRRLMNAGTRECVCSASLQSACPSSAASGKCRRRCGRGSARAGDGIARQQLPTQSAQMPAAGACMPMPRQFPAPLWEGMFSHLPSAQACAAMPQVKLSCCTSLPESKSI